MGVQSSLSEVVARGGEGGLDLANKIKRRVVDETPGIPNFYYKNSDPVKSVRLQLLRRKYIRADGVDYH